MTAQRLKAVPRCRVPVARRPSVRLAVQLIAVLWYVVRFVTSFPVSSGRIQDVHIIQAKFPRNPCSDGRFDSSWNVPSGTSPSMWLVLIMLFRRIRNVFRHLTKSASGNFEVRNHQRVQVVIHLAWHFYQHLSFTITYHFFWFFCVSRHWRLP